MKLSQQKIDLAVLHALHKHAEKNGTGMTTDDVAVSFDIDVPYRRVEIALGQLCERGDAERSPAVRGTVKWQISRAGIETVDRAIKVPTSFIGRLHANGDTWLESDEAQNAVLKKLPIAESAAPTIVATQTPKIDAPTVKTENTIPITINNNYAPSNSQTTGASDSGDTRSAALAGWWNVVIALAVGIAVIFVTLKVAGKI